MSDQRASQRFETRAAFRQAGIAGSLTERRRPGRRDLAETLPEPRLERAIGILYPPDAHGRLTIEKELVIVPGAGPLFDEVVRHATRWFLNHLPAERGTTYVRA